MSYDLSVYTPAAPTPGDLRGLISSVQQLRVGEFDDDRCWYSVLRGEKGKYSFTVDGPFHVEPEDVPDQVTAVLLGAAYVCNVAVEGSTAADVPHAVRFARRLAQTLGGVVVDHQTDELWLKGVGRQAAKPERGQRANVINIDWYTRVGSVHPDFGAHYISLCRRLLPEALPRRFGEYEPLQGKLAETGDEGFARAWRESRSLLFFAASPPCISGSMWAGPHEEQPRPVWRMGLHLHHQPLADDARWRDAVQRLFVAISQDLNSFFASAEVIRGNIWNGRSMWSDGATEWSVIPARRDGWKGLPPYPLWWAWYGEPYTPLVDGRLQGGHVVEYTEGLLHQLAEQPLDRDESRRGLADQGISSWTPPELLSQVRRNDGRVQPVPLAAADLVPAGLL